MNIYINKCLIISLLIAGVVSSCKKKNNPEPAPTIGYVSLHNAALLLPRAGNVLVDNVKANNANFIGYLSNITGNWVGVQEGNRSIALKDSSASAAANWASKTIVAQAGKAISVFTYDTLNATTGQVRIMALTTDLTTPPLGRSNVRFLHLSPDAPVVDVALLRINDTRTAYVDSVKIIGVPFAGATPNETALSVLSSIPSGLYHIRVRPTGTFTNAVSVGTTFTTGQILIQGKIYTIFARGFLTNTGPGRTTATTLGASVVLHNP